MEFLNLNNYGNYEEKLKHTFEFFDLRNYGVIEKNDFREVVYELCLYFSSISTTQSKLIVYLLTLKFQLRYVKRI